MKKDNKLTIIIIATLLLFLACATGWGMNVYKLVNLDFQPPYKAEVIRSLGVIPPIGAFVGYFSIED